MIDGGIMTITTPSDYKATNEDWLAAYYEITYLREVLQNIRRLASEGVMPDRRIDNLQIIEAMAYKALLPR